MIEKGKRHGSVRMGGRSERETEGGVRGSFALRRTSRKRSRGEARENSDIDLVVLLDRVSAAKRQELIDLLLRWSEEVIDG